MPTIADSFVYQQSAILEERIGSSAMDLLQFDDPIFEEMVLNPMAINAQLFNANGGRDYLIKKRFTPRGVTGVIQGGHLRGMQNLYGPPMVDAGSKHLAGDIDNTNVAASPRETLFNQSFGMTMKLWGVDTDLLILKTMLDLDATDANISEHFMPHIDGFARNIRKFLCNSWHADPTNGYRMCTTGAASTISVDAGTKTFTFKPAEGTLFKFTRGQRIDFRDPSTDVPINSTAGSEATRVAVYVDDIDPYENIVSCFCLSNATFTWAVAASLASMNVVPAGVYTVADGYQGFYSWKHFYVPGHNNTAAQNYILRDDAITTTSLDYIDVRKHKAFKSGRFPNFGVLNEMNVLRVIQTMQAANTAFGHDYDTFFVGEGAILKLWEQYQGAVEFDRGNPGGSPANLQNLGLQSGNRVKFRLGDFVLEGIQNRYFDRGTGLIMKRKNNWAIITPPSPKTPSGSSRYAPKVNAKMPFEFTMSWLQDGNPLYPVAVVDAEDQVSPMPEWGRMPGQIRAQMVPVEQIPMVAIEGMSTSFTYSTPEGS